MKAQIAELVPIKAQLAALQRAVRVPPGDADEIGETVTDRRQLLKHGALLAAGAVAGGAALVASQAAPAGAASGDPMVLGTAMNAGSSNTSIGSTSSSGTLTVTSPGPGTALTVDVFANSVAAEGVVINNAGNGVALAITNSDATSNNFGVFATSNGTNSLFVGSTTNSANSAACMQIEAHGSGPAVLGIGSGTGTGVMGSVDTAASGATAVFGDTAGHGPGVSGQSASGYGVRAASSASAALFVDETGLAAVPPTSGAWTQGAFVVKSGHLWYCYKSGTPGAWVKMSGGFVPLATPKRVYDSRAANPIPGQGPKTPLNGLRQGIDLTYGASGVPTNITGALVNLVVANTANANPGYAAIFRNGPNPGTSSINWTGANQTLAVTTFTNVDALSRVALYSPVNTDIVIDVLGYYP